ncbi:MAG: carnitine dehydratase, partial [Variovorax sp.]|nr:carnitine dehydratase [Variovorax sp.]
LMSAFSAFRQMGEWTDGRGENIVDGGAPFYGTYETRDGKYVAVGAIEARFYEALTAGMGLQVAQLPPQNDRSTWARVRAQFVDIFRTRTRDEWVAAMEGRDACFSPVLDLDEAPRHPHLQSRRVFSAFDGVLHPSPAPRFGRTAASLRRPAPTAGQHSAEVLVEWGVGDTEIEALQRSGAMLQVDAPGR